MKFVNLALVLIGVVSVSCGQEKKTSHKLQQETILDRENIIATLDTIQRLDSEPLILRDSMSKIYGPESEEAQFYQKIFWKNNPSNIKKVKEILGEKNWPDTTLIGQRGNVIICTVLQHANQETREHYIPRMKQAVLDKKLEASGSSQK